MTHATQAPELVPPQIRVFCEADRDAVIALWDLVFPDDPPWNEPAGVIDRKMTVQADLFFVCEAGDVLVGTTMAGFDGHRGWVHKVAVHPDYRRQGVARLLMEAAEAGLAAKGCTKLNLQVRAGNDGAVSFYTDLGFAIEQRTSMGKKIGGGE